MEALDLGRWLGCPRRCGRRPTSGRSSGRRDPPTLRLSYADGFGVLRAALTVCTDRGFAVNDIDVTREDLDDAGDRVAAVTLQLAGRGDLSSLAGELAELPGVRAAHTGPADTD